MSKLHEQARFIKQQLELGRAKAAAEQARVEKTQLSTKSLPASGQASPTPTPSPVIIRQTVKVEDNQEILIARRKLNLEQDRIGAEKEALRISKERLEMERLAQEQVRLRLQEEQKILREKEERERLAKEQEQLKLQELYEVLKKDREELAQAQAAMFQEKINKERELLKAEKEALLLEQQKISEMRQKIEREAAERMAEVQREHEKIRNDQEQMRVKLSEIQKQQDLLAFEKARPRLQEELKQKITAEQESLITETPTPQQEDKIYVVGDTGNLNDFEII